MEGLVISSPARSRREGPASPTPRGRRDVVDLCSPPSPSLPLSVTAAANHGVESDAATPLARRHAQHSGRSSPCVVSDTSDAAPSRSILFIDSQSDDGQSHSYSARSNAEEWGHDAVLEWDGAWDGEADDAVAETYDNDDDDDEGEEIHDIDAISDDDQPSRGSTMPMYEEWDTARLQQLVKRYGFRVTSDRRALIQIASDCWKAMKPTPAAPPAKSRKGKGKGKSAANPADGVNTATKNNRPRADTNGTAGKASAPQELAELHAKFHSMIVDDEAFWIRVLRYEPISFDELVSRAFAAGVSGTGWQPKLKRYLDLKGVTYYTSDPTTARRGRYK